MDKNDQKWCSTIRDIITLIQHILLFCQTRPTLPTMQLSCRQRFKHESSSWCSITPEASSTVLLLNLYPPDTTATKEILSNVMNSSVRTGSISKQSVHTNLLGSVKRSFLLCPILLCLQLPEPPHARSISLHRQHCWGRSCLLLFVHGPMPSDPRLHNPQHLSWGTAEGPWPPSLLRPTHVTHPLPPWCQSSAPRPHQGNVQPLHQADLETHSQVDVCIHVTSHSGRHRSHLWPANWAYWPLNTGSKPVFDAV